MTKAARSAQLSLDQRLDAELWIAERIADHCDLKRPDLFAGVMSSDQRREVIRTAILSNALSQVTIGKRNGKVENYEQIFHRVYGVKL